MNQNNAEQPYIHSKQTIMGKKLAANVDIKKQRRQREGAVTAQNDWCMPLPWRHRLEPQPWLIVLSGLLQFCLFSLIIVAKHFGKKETHVAQ